jgi:hypothetical protein
MTGRYADFDRRVERWLDEASDSSAAEALLDTVLDATRGRRQRPGWIVALRAGGMGTTRFIAGQPARRVGRALVVLAALLLALAIGLLIAGVGRQPLALNATIAFFRTDDARENNTPFIVNRDGSDETQLAQSAGLLSPDRRLLLSGHEAAWIRPAVSNPDGSGLRVLDAYPDLKMQMIPVAWSPDGSRILVATGGEDMTPSGIGLYTVRSTDGGDLNRLVSTPSGDGDAVRGYSPDGSMVLFSRIGFDPGIFVVNSDGTGLRRLSLPDSVPVDLDFWDAASVDWSADGMQVAFCALDTSSVPSGQSNSDLRGAPAMYLVNRDGSGLHEIVPSRLGALSARWSPSTDTIAFTSGHLGLLHTPAGKELIGQPQVWTVHSDRSGLTQLTDGRDRSVSVTPVWSPDGTELLFQRKLGNAVTLWIMNADGTAQRQLTPTPVASDFVGEYGWARLPSR